MAPTPLHLIIGLISIKKKSNTPVPIEAFILSYIKPEADLEGGGGGGACGAPAPLHLIIGQISIKKKSNTPVPI